MSLNDEHKDDIVKLFDKIDFDDSGYIDNEELHNYMTSFQRILNNNLMVKKKLGFIYKFFKTF